MFTTMQSMEVAREIQADHRRRAARWRSTRRHRAPRPIVALSRPALAGRAVHHGPAAIAGGAAAA
jgi:hypothetical protein